MKQYFEIGERVIVNIGRFSIEIAEDGKTELTEEELKKRVRIIRYINGRKLDKPITEIDISGLEIDVEYVFDLDKGEDNGVLEL